MLPELVKRSLCLPVAPAVVEQAKTATANGAGKTSHAAGKQPGTIRNPHSMKRGTSSAYHGVTLMGGKWSVRFRSSGSCISAGVFDDETEAARAFDRATRNIPYYQEHGIRNFPQAATDDGSGGTLYSTALPAAPPVHIGRAPRPLRAGDCASETSWAVKRSWLGHRIYLLLGKVPPTRCADGSVALGANVALCEIHFFYCPPEVKAGHKHKNLFKVLL